MFLILYKHIISFVIWHKLAKFHLKRVLFSSRVIQWNAFLVLCSGIWWHHEICKCRILKFDFSENKKSFWSEKKTVFLVWQVLLLKQTSKNAADTTFKGSKTLKGCWKLLTSKLTQKKLYPRCLTGFQIYLCPCINEISPFPQKLLTRKKKTNSFLFFLCQGIS